MKRRVAIPAAVVGATAVCGWWFVGTNGPQASDPSPVEPPAERSPAQPALLDDRRDVDAGLDEVDASSERGVYTVKLPSLPSTEWTPEQRAEWGREVAEQDLAIALEALSEALDVNLEVLGWECDEPPCIAMVDIAGPAQWADGEDGATELMTAMLQIVNQDGEGDELERFMNQDVMPDTFFPAGEDGWYVGFRVGPDNVEGPDAEMVSELRFARLAARHGAELDVPDGVDPSALYD